ncbi:MAG: hypothetical protein WC291_05400 [Thermodesulfovibrionales bacterium]
MITSDPSCKTASASEALKFWLEEYKALSSDIQNRVTLQHGLFNMNILLAVGLLGFIANLIKTDVNLVASYPIRLLAEGLPLIMSFFVWRHLNHDVNIIDKATYIHTVIRPHVAALSGDTELLGFERFLEKCRRDRLTRFGVVITLGGEHFFHLMFSLAFLMIAYAVFFLQPGHWVLAKNAQEALLFLCSAENGLLLISTLFTIETLKVRLKVAKAYGSIVPNPSSLWC